MHNFITHTIPVLLALGVASLVFGCGGAGTAGEGGTIDLAPRPEEGVRYQILHRESVQLPGQRASRTQTRTLLEVTGVSPDGTRTMRARVFRSVTDGARGERVLDEIATLTVSASGVVLGEPRLRCGSSDELQVGRYLRHLVGARAFVARRIGEGSRWRGDYLSDAIETPSAASFRIDEVGRRGVRGRVRARIEMENQEIGSARVTGRGQVRGRFSASLADGFTGSTDLESTIEGTITVGDSERRGRVQTRSQIRVRRLPLSPTYELSCAAPFDDARVLTLIREHDRQIEACNAGDESARGRVLVRFTIGPGGRVREARAQANDTGNAELAECVVGLVGSFRFDPQPRRGRDGVTIVHPFVFTRRR